MRARPGHGVAHEIETGEGEGYEWAASSWENISQTQPTGLVQLLI